MTATHISLARLGLAMTLVIATATAARADHGYGLDVGSSTRWMSSSSVDALTQHSMTSFSLSADARISALRLPGVDIHVEALWERGSVDGSSFTTLRSDTSVSMYALGARARHHLSPRWRAHGRLLAGLASVGVELVDGRVPSARLADSGRAAATYLGGGMELIIGKQRSVVGQTGISLGVLAEIGYLAMTSVELRPAPSTGDDSIIRMPATAAPLGALDMSAWNMRLALILRL